MSILNGLHNSFLFVHSYPVAGALPSTSCPQIKPPSPLSLMGPSATPLAILLKAAGQPLGGTPTRQALKAFGFSLDLNPGFYSQAS